MNRLLTVPLMPLLAAVLVGCASGRVAVPPALTLPDASGRTVRPLAGKGTRAVVFVFLANECPIANRAVPELRRLHAAYAPRGAAFWFVHANADETDEAVRAHAQDFSLPVTPLRDPGSELAQAVGARVTPTAVIVSPQGEVLYRGRIDDRYAALGTARPEPTRHDLELALAEVLAGRRPDPCETRAVGCRIVGTP